MTWRMLTQRDSPQNARRSPMSSASDAARPCSLAACTASMAGSMVAGYVQAGALHVCQPARGASVAQTAISAPARCAAWPAS